MTQPAKSQEPSMEEILASIRRIIADDPVRTARPDTPRAGALRTAKPQPHDPGSRDPAAFSGRRDDLLRPLPPRDEGIPNVPRPFSSGRAEEAEPPGRPAAPFRGASPLPPISPLRDDHSSAALPKPISPQQEIDAMVAELNSRTRVASRAAEEPAADILELTDEVSAEETPADVVPAPARHFDDINAADELPLSATALDVEMPGPELPEQEEEIAPEEVQPQAYAAEAEPEPLADLRQPMADAMDEGLISATTTAAVDSAFNTLAQTVLVQNARTLEDLVREMLRPMLKIWLDDNLPGLVERLVRAEIERVSRGRG